MFFEWLRACVRNAFLGGIQDGIRDLHAGSPEVGLLEFHVEIKALPAPVQEPKVEAITNGSAKKRIKV